MLSQTQSPTGQKPGSGTWGPDGETIYFPWSELGGGTDIWKVNKDGSGLAMVLNAAAGENLVPTDVSVDGDLLTYSRNLTGTSTSTLHIMNLSGGATSSFGTAHAGSFSPDGTRIAFSARLAGDAGQRIYTSKLDWTDVRRVTDSGGDDVSPSWSPDGQTIAYLKFGVGISATATSGLNNRLLIANKPAYS